MVPEAGANGGSNMSVCTCELYACRRQGTPEDEMGLEAVEACPGAHFILADAPSLGMQASETQGHLKTSLLGSGRTRLLLTLLHARNWFEKVLTHPHSTRDVDAV